MAMEQNVHGDRLEEQRYGLSSTANEPNLLHLTERNPCYVVCNINFTSRKRLFGYNTDKENINNTFQQLNFDVKIKNNLTGDEMRKLFNGEDFSDAQCIVCFILSHGDDDDVLCGTEDRVYLDEILSPLCENDQLKGKPKLFFIQACRGAEGADKYEVEGAFQKAGPNLKTNSKFHDTFLYFSTVKGEYVVVHREFGSPFISNICNVFQEYSDTLNLSELVLIINENVSTTLCKIELEQEDVCQAPEIASTLDYDLVFHGNSNNFLEDLTHSSKHKQKENEDHLMLHRIKCNNSYIKAECVSPETLDFNSAKSPSVNANESAIASPMIFQPKEIVPVVLELWEMYNNASQLKQNKKNDQPDLQPKPVAVKKGLATKPRSKTMGELPALKPDENCFKKNFCFVFANSKCKHEMKYDFESDRKDVEETFEFLNCEVQSVKNCNLKEMRDEFRTLFQKDYTDYNCFIAAVLSCGGTSGSVNAIYGTDGKFYAIETVLNKLSAITTLQGKPKLLIMLFSNHDELTKLAEMEAMQNDGQPQQKKLQKCGSMKFKAAKSDIFVFYATIGAGSRKSVFIQSLCLILKEYSHKGYPLSKVVIKVNELCRQNGECSEIPEVCHTLTRDIYFQGHHAETDIDLHKQFDQQHLTQGSKHTDKDNGNSIMPGKYVKAGLQMMPDAVKVSPSGAVVPLKRDLTHSSKSKRNKNEDGLMRHGIKCNNYYVKADASPETLDFNSAISPSVNANESPIALSTNVQHGKMVPVVLWRGNNNEKDLPTFEQASQPKLIKKNDQPHLQTKPVAVTKSRCTSDASQLDLDNTTFRRNSLASLSFRNQQKSGCATRPRSNSLGMIPELVKEEELGLPDEGLKDYKEFFEKYKQHVQEEQRKCGELKGNINRSFRNTNTKTEDILKQPKSVLISGEAGLGKSRLANHLLYLWACGTSDDMIVLKYNCREINRMMTQDCNIAPLYLSELGKFIRNDKGKEYLSELYEKFVKQKAKEKKIIVIIDGVDELSVDRFLSREFYQELESKIEDGKKITGIETLLSLFFGLLYTGNKLIVLGRNFEIEKFSNVQGRDIPSSSLFDENNREIYELNRFSDVDVQQLTCMNLCNKEKDFHTIDFGSHSDHSECPTRDHGKCCADKYFESKCGLVFKEFMNIELKNVPSFAKHIIEIFHDTDQQFEKDLVEDVTKGKLLIRVLFKQLNNHTGQGRRYKSWQQLMHAPGNEYLKTTLIKLSELCYRCLIKEQVIVPVEIVNDEIVYSVDEMKDEIRINKDTLYPVDEMKVEIRINKDTLEKLDIFYVREDEVATIEPYHLGTAEFLAACHFATKGEETWDYLWELHEERLFVMLPLIVAIMAEQPFAKAFAKYVFQKENLNSREFYECLFKQNGNSLPYGRELNTWHGLSDDGNRIMPHFKLLKEMSRECEIPQDLLPKRLEFKGCSFPSFARCFHIEELKECYKLNKSQQYSIPIFCESYPDHELSIKGDFKLEVSAHAEHMATVTKLPKVQLHIETLKIEENVENEEICIELIPLTRELIVKSQMVILPSILHAIVENKSTHPRLETLQVFYIDKMKIETVADLLEASLNVQAVFRFGVFTNKLSEEFNRLISEDSRYRQINIKLCIMSFETEECAEVLSNFRGVYLQYFRQLNDNHFRRLIESNRRQGDKRGKPRLLRLYKMVPGNPSLSMIT